MEKIRDIRQHKGVAGELIKAGEAWLRRERGAVRRQEKCGTAIPALQVDEKPRCGTPALDADPCVIPPIEAMKKPAQAAQKIARTKRGKTRRVPTDAAHIAQILGETGVYVWEMDIAGAQSMSDAAWLEMLGQPHAETRGLDAWEQVVHPHDWDEVRNGAMECLEGRAQRFEIEHRVIARDGACKWMRTRGKRIVEGGTGAVRLIGTHVDITEQRNADELRKIMERVFDASPQAMIITDARRNVVAANAAFRHKYGNEPLADPRTGVAASEAAALPAYADLLWESVTPATESEGRWQGEVKRRLASGEVMVEWLDLVELKDSAGRISHHIAMLSDIADGACSDERARYLADHDVLTGLLNRRGLGERLQQALGAARRRGGSLGLLYLDLDGLKAVNDDLGHAAGDRLLQDVGVRLRAALPAEVTVGRRGGDEFVVLLPELAGAWEATQVAERLLQALARPHRLEGRELRLGASIGIGLYPEDAPDAEGLLRRAAAAMYQAKRSGRNHYYFAGVEANAQHGPCAASAARGARA